MYKKLSIILFLLFSSPAIAKKEALLIGVSDYGGSPINDLMGIDLDIHKMEQLFKSWGFVPKVLYNQNSLKIEEYLEKYANSLNSNDTFIFYYSGHGSSIPDKNGDEADGKDEVLVLSDGVRNIPYLDDNLNHYLNKIKAKKLIIFDCCHSGTANRGGGSNIKAKNLPSNELGTPLTKGISVDVGVSSGTYIVLSASKDNEKSLATYDGSLFTNEIYKLLQTQTTLENIRNEATYDIFSYAKKYNKKPHHPQFTYSNPLFGNQSIGSYLRTITRTTLQSKLDSLIENPQISKIAIFNNPTSYNTGEFVNFKLDTNGNRGYLTILFVEGEKTTVLYPNPRALSKVISGNYTFPRDFGNFKVRAFKNCNGCQKDKTSIYLILTPQPLTNIQNITTQKLFSFTNGSNRDRAIRKDVELIFDEPTKTPSSSLMVGRYDFFVY
jgi:hypothetical protein